MLQDRSNAEVSCAGLFIGAQLGFDFPGVWIHVDMAYPVYMVGECFVLLERNKNVKWELKVMKCVHTAERINSRAWHASQQRISTLGDLCDPWNSALTSRNIFHAISATFNARECMTVTL